MTSRCRCPPASASKPEAYLQWAAPRRGRYADGSRHYVRGVRRTKVIRERRIFGRKRRAAAAAAPRLAARPTAEAGDRRTASAVASWLALWLPRSASTFLANRPHSSIAPNRPCHCRTSASTISWRLHYHCCFRWHSFTMAVAPTWRHHFAPPPLGRHLPLALPYTPPAVVGIGVLTSVIVVHEAIFWRELRHQGL